MSCPNTLDLCITRNKVGIWFLSVYQADGTTPQSLVGATLYFHAAFDDFSIDKYSPSNGITIQTIGGGADCATLQVDAADTEDISDTATVGMPCELTMVVSTVPYELAKGTFHLSPGVGTP